MESNQLLSLVVDTMTPGGSTLFWGHCLPVMSFLSPKPFLDRVGIQVCKRELMKRGDGRGAYRRPHLALYEWRKLSAVSDWVLCN